jgi:hypothetical protein
MKSHMVSVAVACKGYEADDYGRAECFEASIKVPLIRVAKAVMGGSLKGAKDAVEEIFSQPVGREVITFITNDAGMGRLAILLYGQVELAKIRGEHTYSTMEIVELKTLGSEVIVA